jgi:predicted Zn-dependent protease
MATPRIRLILIRILSRISILLFTFFLAAPLSSVAQSPGELLKGLGSVLGNKDDRTRSAPQGKDPTNPIAGLIGSVTGNQGDEEEIRAGEGVAAMVLGAARPVANDRIQRYVNLVGRTISQRSDRMGLPWSFVVIDTSSINAFAAPGGVILVTAGLYEMLETEDELAAVLAHEIAHVNRAHHYKVMKQQETVEVGSNFLQRALAKDGGSAMTARFGRMGAELLARGLDKEAEFEADQDGLVLAARAGYDSSALVSVLTKLQRRERGDGALSLLFKTHPSPTDRIDRIVQNLSPDLESSATLSTAADRIKSEGR